MATALSPTHAASLRDVPRRQVRLAALRVPLVAKLVGANLLVVSAMLAAWRIREGVIDSRAAAAALAVVVLQLALVLLALQPIRDLERAVARVWRGDFRARVERSSLADHEVLRVGAMFNILLDGLDEDRARMQALAGEVIAVGDRERAMLGRALHDSTAQDLAALMLQLAAAARRTHEPKLGERLLSLRDTAAQILEHVRELSQSVHPGVLDGLGLEAALRKLGRDHSHGRGIDVDVDVRDLADRLPQGIEEALYRVAQEAIANAVRHASAGRIRIALCREGPSVRLEIHDDGSGFDLAVADRPGHGMGLLCMRERIARVGGALRIRTARGNGTTVSVTVPGAAHGPPEPLENA